MDRKKNSGTNGQPYVLQSDGAPCDSQVPLVAFLHSGLAKTHNVLTNHTLGEIYPIGREVLHYESEQISSACLAGEEGANVLQKNALPCVQ